MAHCNDSKCTKSSVSGDDGVRRCACDCVTCADRDVARPRTEVPLNIFAPEKPPDAYDEREQRLREREAQKRATSSWRWLAWLMLLGMPCALLVWCGSTLKDCKDSRIADSTTPSESKYSTPKSVPNEPTQETRLSPQEAASEALRLMKADSPTAASYCQAKTYLDALEGDDVNILDARQARSLMSMVEQKVIAAERAAASTGLAILCNDGTMSPSCMCEGPRKGCCSRHGGVKGCESPRKVNDKISCK